VSELESEETTRPERWDPKPHQRQWFSHARTADRGYLVIRDGVDHMKYDQPNMDRTIPYVEGDWRKDELPQKMTKLELAKVCHAADQQLCLAMHLYPEKRKDWKQLTGDEQRAWMAVGPKHPKRRLLFAAIHEALKGDVED
jgi:hypothetical protein